MPTELVRRARFAAAACPCLPFDWNNAGTDADVRVIAPPAQPSGRVGATGRTRRIGGCNDAPRGCLSAWWLWNLLQMTSRGLSSTWSLDSPISFLKCPGTPCDRSCTHRGRSSAAGPSAHSFRSSPSGMRVNACEVFGEPGEPARVRARGSTPVASMRGLYPRQSILPGNLVRDSISMARVRIG